MSGVHEFCKVMYFFLNEQIWVLHILLKNVSTEYFSVGMAGNWRFFGKCGDILGN
jgi:hypothetical protein